MHVFISVFKNFHKAVLQLLTWVILCLNVLPPVYFFYGNMQCYIHTWLY